MRAIDTNVLVRLVVGDDRKQLDAAEQFVTKGAWVSHLVLAELTWVFSSVFELQQEQLVTAVEMLLNHEHLTIQDADVVATALASFKQRSAVTFSDHLILEIARRNGHLPLGTFDRDLAKLDGAERL